jgi:hypothetical protein
MAATTLNLNGAETGLTGDSFEVRQTPQEMKQMRKKGLPWLLAASALLIVVLLVLLVVFAVNGFGGVGLERFLLINTSHLELQYKSRTSSIQ